MKESEETVEALERGYDDAAHGRVHSLEEVLQELDLIRFQNASDTLVGLSEPFNLFSEQASKMVRNVKEFLGVDSTDPDQDTQQTGLKEENNG